MVLAVNTPVVNVLVPIIFPPTSASYQVIVPTKVPVTEAVKVDVLPLQIVSFVVVKKKLDIVSFGNPIPPDVAPFAGNSVNPSELVVPFAPPFAVVNDLAWLGGLSERDKRGGYSEAVKVALIRDQAFFEEL